MDKFFLTFKLQSSMLIDVLDGAEWHAKSKVMNCLGNWYWGDSVDQKVPQ